MVLAKSYINVAHDDTHLTKYSHMGSNYVLFIFKQLLFIFHSHISAPSRWFRFMVFNATFNNISVISWLPVLLMEETGVPREITDKHYHIMLYRPSAIRTHNISGDRY